MKKDEFFADQPCYAQAKEAQAELTRLAASISEAKNSLANSESSARIKATILNDYLAKLQRDLSFVRGEARERLLLEERQGRQNKVQQQLDPKLEASLAGAQSLGQLADEYRQSAKAIRQSVEAASGKSSINGAGNYSAPVVEESPKVNTPVMAPAPPSPASRASPFDEWHRQAVEWMERAESLHRANPGYNGTYPEAPPSAPPLPDSPPAPVALPSPEVARSASLTPQPQRTTDGQTGIEANEQRVREEKTQTQVYVDPAEQNAAHELVQAAFAAGNLIRSKILNQIGKGEAVDGVAAETEAVRAIGEETFNESAGLAMSAVDQRVIDWAKRQHLFADGKSWNELPTEDRNMYGALGDLARHAAGLLSRHFDEGVKAGNRLGERFEEHLQQATHEPDE